MLFVRNDRQRMFVALYEGRDFYFVYESSPLPKKGGGFYPTFPTFTL